MSIHLDPNNQTKVQPNGQQTKTGITAKQNSAKSNDLLIPTTTSKHADKVELTASAETMRSLEQAIKELPEIDYARVAELKQAIDSGQYQENIDQTVKKMMDLELSDDLLSKG